MFTHISLSSSWYFSGVTFATELLVFVWWVVFLKGRHTSFFLSLWLVVHFFYGTRRIRNIGNAKATFVTWHFIGIRTICAVHVDVDLNRFLAFIFNINVVSKLRYVRIWINIYSLKMKSKQWMIYLTLIYIHPLSFWNLLLCQWR